MLSAVKTVLIGASLTEENRLVVRAGLKVARAANARVVLSHAVPPQVAADTAVYLPEMAEVIEAQRESCRRQLEELALGLGIEAGERAGTFVEMGAPHAMLIEAAHAAKADLIVVGATESPIRSKLLGSTADQIVRNASCPILVIRRELPVPPARVLLPVDLSFLSAEGFRAGLKIVGLLAGEHGPGVTTPEVEALCVVTDLDIRLLAPGEGSQQAEKEVRGGLERFIALHAADSAFPVVPRTVYGCAEDEILLRMQEWEPDLVALATHGRGRCERLLTGSVATRILNDSAVNILIVPMAAVRKKIRIGTVEREALVG